jgi:ABC-type lipoprotein export system ATPase subunit
VGQATRFETAPTLDLGDITTYIFGHERWPTMQSLNVDLEHCYGIKKLEHNFDFAEGSAIAVYAPNGSMKTSFAQTFKDLAENTSTRDRIFPARETVRKITDEKGAELSKDDIFVVVPYNESYESMEKTSVLLVNAALQKEHDRLIRETEASQKMFIRNLKTQSGSKKDLETEISLAFTKTDKEFLVALSRVKDEVENMQNAPLASVQYDVIFDDSVQAFLETEDFKTAIKEYIERYEELLTKSVYFKKGIFNYYNAATIAKNLADNGFFKAQHAVNLKAQNNLEITSKEQLIKLIEDEKAKITDDQALKQKLDEINKQLERTIALRTFREYLHQHLDLLPQLANLAKLKEDIWKSYFKDNIDLYRDLLSKYQDSRQKIQEIKAAAEAEGTQWETVLHIFNTRFHVPFTVAVKNKIEVMVGAEEVPILGFRYKDGDESATVERKDLDRVLSTGEKKALYVLNIIFAMEARRHAKQETVFVVDDIADSFDYKNKYAIIQYLRDISEESFFKQIVLTHNFDFFRTICSRFVGYSRCFMVSKSDTQVTLESAEGVHNVFINDWKKNFFTDPKKQIASIPFIRNLIEFTKDKDDPDYIKLTSLLHWKEDTPNITQRDLDAIFNRVFNGKGASPDGTKNMMNIFNEMGDECLKADEGMNFENKIVLSILIRICSERFMIGKIKDDAFVAGIKGNQTFALFDKWKQQNQLDSETTEILQAVLLMTPESIHLNAFMYEPIIDMADGQLRRLLTRVRGLQ